LTRACIFCGKTPTTREHIFPQWVSRLLVKSPRGFPSKNRMILRSGSGEHTWQSHEPINFVAKCVCADCNGGWMHDIEQSAQPVLTSMIMGQRTTLDAEAQGVVATWIGLKAIVGRYGHRPVDPVDRDWLDHFYVNHRPPETWYEWITGYVGKSPFYYEGRDITLTLPDDPTFAATTPHGVLMALIVGYLAVKVLGIRQGTPSEPGATRLFRIWPTTSDSFLSWPPDFHVDDASLDTFRLAFSGS